MCKSHVSMETHVCVVCGQEFDTGSILLDTRIVNGELRKSMERKTCTAWGMCEEHEKLRADGYIALVACDESKSGAKDKDNIKPANAYRLGEIAHLRAHVFAGVFDVPVPKDGVCFCGPDVLEALKAMQVKE